FILRESVMGGDQARRRSGSECGRISAVGQAGFSVASPRADATMSKVADSRGTPRGPALLQFNGDKKVEFCDGLTRRDFLRAGALSAGAVGLSLAELAEAGPGTSRDLNCIVLFLVGGPSHLDTFDLKPSAPAEVRGPFRPIHT